jgi:hypothetical protein
MFLSSDYTTKLHNAVVEVCTQKYYFITEYYPYNLSAFSAQMYHRLSDVQFQFLILQILKSIRFLNKKKCVPYPLMLKDFVCSHNLLIKIVNSEFLYSYEDFNAIQISEITSIAMLRYLPPEVHFSLFCRPEPFSIWIAGLLFIELLTGKTLFKSEIATIFAIENNFFTILGGQGKEHLNEMRASFMYQFAINRKNEVPKLREMLEALIPLPQHRIIMLIAKMLSWEIDKRPTIEECISDCFFDSADLNDSQQTTSVNESTGTIARYDSSNKTKKHKKKEHGSFRPPSFIGE